MPTKTTRALTKPRATEDQLQDAIVEFAQSQGWFCFFIPNWLYRLAIQAMARKKRGDRKWSPPGFPDLVLLQGLNDPRTPVRLIFMELKVDGGKFSSGEQSDWVRGLRRVAGIEVYVLESHDYFNGVVESILQNGPMEHHETTERYLARKRPKDREEIRAERVV